MDFAFEILITCEKLTFQVYYPKHTAFESELWLISHPNDIFAYDKSASTKYCKQVLEYSVNQVWKQPIRASDYKSSIVSLESIQLPTDSNWTNQQKVRLAQIWEIFSRDYDAVCHHIIHEWNKVRKLFVKYSNTIHGLYSSINDIDNNFEEYLDYVGSNFKLMLWKWVLNILGSSHVGAIDEQFKGFTRGASFKREKSRTDDLDLTINALRMTRKVSKIEKFKITKRYGITLEELNGMLE